MPKHKYIETPEKMWELFETYKKETKSNPILVHDFVGKDGESVYRAKERPLTMEGFSTYCWRMDYVCHTKDYFANSRGLYETYSTVCSRIKEEIRQDQIEGGMAGIYNPSITQRLNGLVEKTQTDIKVEQPLFPDQNKKE